jgi:hypothetical protein
MGLPRYRLVCVAALTAYLVVNVGVGALHHHQHPEAATRPGDSPAARDLDLRFQTPDPDDDDDDDEETCLLCSVLHLAQTAPGQVHVEVLIVPSGETLAAAAPLPPPLFETPTRARSPPRA